MRRPVPVLLALALGLASSLPSLAEDDAIRWIRADGAAGWTASLPHESRPAGSVATPLAAPTWFPKLPKATIDLVPTGKLDLAATRGKIVVLDYWASWCGPCQRELPHLQALHASRASKGVVAIAINVDEDAATAEASAKRIGLTMPVGLNDVALYRALGAKSLPTLLVIDRQGRIRARWNGYRTGYEKEIAAKVDALLADETSDTEHPIADVLAGAGLVSARWTRDLPGNADGVVALPAGRADGARALVAAGGLLIPFEADGDSLPPKPSSSAAGRLLDFGVGADGAREIAGYRPGGNAVSIVVLESGAERTIAVPAPIVDAAVARADAGAGRHLAVATMGGAMLASAADTKAQPLDGAGAVRAVASRAGHGVLALRADGSIAPLDAAAAAWPVKAEGAERLLAASDDGAAVGPRTVIAAASGRFVAGPHPQIAVATYAGHLAILSRADGRLLVDIVWADVHDLAATDLDGDGMDELIVAAGRTVSALGAAPEKRAAAKGAR